MGKLCSIIIDGDNSVNITSLRLVENLAILTFLTLNLINCNVLMRGVRFSFEHIGKKVVLKPLSPREVNKDQNKMRMKRDEERKIEKKKEKERKKINEKIKSMEKLFEEFKYVFSKDVPHGLPPLRATLPNWAAYWTNLEESQEIQKQVGKLIEKGWVRESMNPCSMLVILVPKKDGTWRICIDCRLINNISVRYRHLIPCLDELLGELHGS
ncbi:hypothetical protein CR513_39536, partial [Mucuna pruriens]